MVVVVVVVVVKVVVEIMAHKVGTQKKRFSHNLHPCERQSPIPPVY